MKPEEESKIIQFDSPEAAQQVTVTLWKASGGKMFSDESAARYTGCTHRPCLKCGELTEKWTTMCNQCRGIASDERWKTRPRKQWDGHQMVYSELTEEYYGSPDEALESNEPHTLDELRLRLCKHEIARIDADTFQDITPEDGELPSEVLNAIDAFNASVAKVECCWVPGEFGLEDSHQ